MSRSFLQLAIDWDTVTVYASSKAGRVPVLLDRADADRLGTKGLSLGSHGYAAIWHDGQSTPLHRWVMGCERGDGKYVDHLNGDPHDCRRANLRFVTPQENAANRRCTAASGFRGVYDRRGRFHAQGKVKGRNYHLGTFATAEEAAQVAHDWRTRNLPGYVGRGFNAATVKSVAA